MTINEYRVAHKLTQDDLAERIGVSRGAVAQWENGISLPSMDNALKLINASEGEITLEGINAVKKAA